MALRGGTVEASWEGEDCLTGGMYSGDGPQCDAGWINWIFWKLYFDSTIDVRRPCGSQHQAFAACSCLAGVLLLVYFLQAVLSVNGLPLAPVWSWIDVL